MAPPGSAIGITLVGLATEDEIGIVFIYSRCQLLNVQVQMHITRAQVGKNRKLAHLQGIGAGNGAGSLVIQKLQLFDRNVDADHFPRPVNQAVGFVFL